MKEQTLWSRWYFIVSGFLLIFTIYNVLYAEPVSAAKEPIVRVLLLEKQATVKIGGSMEIKGLSKKPQPFTGNKTYKHLELKTTITITAQSGLLNVNGKPYRGEIVIKPTIDGLMVVNRVSIEEYLFGVLPSEVDPKWPMESLKAQAIAARSYALMQAKGKASLDYDLFSDQRSQVYYGARLENASCTEAVLATRGQVAAYNGEVIMANFFAAGGGTTANSEDVWGLAIPYLKSVEDYDQQSPHFSWKVNLKVEDVQAKLEANGISLGRLVDIYPYEKDLSNRVKTVMIVGESGELVMPGTKFRVLLGLKSTNFSINTSASTIFTSAHIEDEGRAGRDTVEPRNVPLDTTQTISGSLATTTKSAVGAAESRDSELMAAVNSVFANTANTIGAFIFGNKGSQVTAPPSLKPSETPEEMLMTIETLPMGVGDMSFVEMADPKSIEVETAEQSVSHSADPTANLIAQIFDFYENQKFLRGSIEIAGNGWGHGVGMSQWGAKEMAQNGATYQQILAHYYQGIEIMQMYK